MTGNPLDALNQRLAAVQRQRRLGLVPLKAVRDSLEAAGLGGDGVPVTVDLVPDASF